MKLAVIVAVIGCQLSVVGGPLLGAGGGMDAKPQAAVGAGAVDAGPGLPEVDKRFVVRNFVWAPAIHSPASIAVGADGRVFVGEDEYNTIAETPVREEGLDRVKLCVDTDGDGKADRVTVFAKGINSPQGMCFVGDTLFVVNAPYLTAFRDLDGDGAADERVNLVTGLGPRPADLVHHVPSGVHYGLDGFLYISVGDKGIPPYAVGRDGRKIMLHGGGVVRVRPDGTELEVYTTGQRNFMDVSISPTMDMFTRDNTNDGQGWNSRLTQILRGANLGYPSLFVSFGDEIIQPLADYGAGSATGAQYVKEGVIPGAYGDGLYTCDWARGAVYRHELTAAGASFKVTQSEFLKKSSLAPTDVDVDGRGNLYVSDWGRYSWGASGAVGAVYVASYKGGPKVAGFPEVRTVSGVGLVGLLRLNSAVYRREGQWEILRRGRDEGVEEALEGLVEDKSADVGARVAGLFTLVQLMEDGGRVPPPFPREKAAGVGEGVGGGKGGSPLGGAEAMRYLERVVRDAGMREFALRAMADRDPFLGEVNPQIFVACLGDANPRVRVQACVGLGRLRRAYTARRVVPLIADRDPMVSQAAMVAVRRIGEVDAVGAYLTGEGTAEVVKGALRALRDMHSMESVGVMEGYLAEEKRPELRKEAVRALGRLYGVEAPWDLAWWRPWPDTRGPYYRQARWEGTSRVGGMLVSLVGDSDREVAKAAVAMCGQCRVVEALSVLAGVVERKGVLRAEAARAILEMKSSDPVAMGAMERVVMGREFEDGVRAEAVAALAGMDSGEARGMIVRLVGELDGEEKAGGVLEKACDALGGKGVSAELTPGVVRLLSAREKRVRVAAGMALLRSENAGAKGAIVEALGGEKGGRLSEQPAPEGRSAEADPTSSAGATEAVLGAIAGVPAESTKGYWGAVRGLVTDRRVGVRRAALLAVGHFGEKEDVGLLLGAGKKYVDREVVAEALSGIEPAKVGDGEVVGAGQVVVDRAVGLAKASGADQALYGRMLAVAQKYASDKRVPVEVARGWIGKLKQSGVILAYQRTKMIAVGAGESPFKKVMRVEERAGGPFEAFTVGDETVGWSAVESRDAKGVVALEPVGNAVAYLHAEVDGGSGGGAGLLSYGMDDGVQMWVNGAKVVSKDLDGQCRADSEREVVELRGGTNVLLIKVDNHAGPCEVQARVRTKAGELSEEELGFVKSKIPGSGERGKALFASLGCVKCHTVDAKEERKGPYLGDAGGRLEVKAIIESIRRPSAKIAQGFETTRVVTSSGEEYLGFVVKESGEEIAVRDASGKVAVVSKGKIAKRETLPGSIMPEGLTDGLSLEEFSSLVGYLGGMKRGGAGATATAAAAAAVAVGK